LLSTLDNVAFVVLAIAGALVFWWIMGWLWPAELRRQHNDITGWQLSVLGTTYAVILGFMLFAAWADFRAAEQNCEREAACLINLYWAASGLPDAQRTTIRELAVEYADTIVQQEWPAMSRGSMNEAASRVVQRMWAAVSQSQTLSATQQVSLEQTMTELSSITEHRRIRQFQNESSLPLILWLVLLAGGFVTMVSASLFGSQRPTLHMLQIITLALLLALALVAVGDVNRPFRGVVHVKPTAFENAKTIFEKYGASSESPKPER
jgi:hypothetical protein